ncbi:hypothetical protein D1872_213820 [compost metagenome]
MVNILIIANELFLIQLCKRLATVTVRSYDRPVILIHEHLVYTQLMCLPLMRESGMKDDKHLSSSRIGVYRIVSRGNIAVSSACTGVAYFTIEQEITYQLVAISCIFGVCRQNSILSFGIFIRSCRFLGTE